MLLAQEKNLHKVVFKESVCEPGCKTVSYQPVIEAF